MLEIVVYAVVVLTPLDITVSCVAYDLHVFLALELNHVYFFLAATIY